MRLNCWLRIPRRLLQTAPTTYVSPRSFKNRFETLEPQVLAEYQNLESQRKANLKFISDKLNNSANQKFVIDLQELLSKAKPVPLQSLNEMIETAERLEALKLPISLVEEMRFTGTPLNSKLSTTILSKLFDLYKDGKIESEALASFLLASFSKPIQAIPFSLDGEVVNHLLNSADERMLEFLATVIDAAQQQGKLIFPKNLIETILSKAVKDV